jgi:hypothetical protein
VALLAAVCCLCAALAWRLTRSKICVVLSAILAPAVITWNWNGTQPHYWLVWYPCHHDLLMIGCLLGALTALDIWLETGGGRLLVLTWCLFLAGALSKEFLYVFPLMAFALAFGRTGKIVIERRRILEQLGIMLLVVVGLYCLRLLVLPNPYNPPHISPKHIVWNAMLFLVPSFYHNVRTPEYIGLAVVIVTLLVTHVSIRFGRLRPVLSKPFTWIPIWCITIAVLWLYSTLTFPSAGQAFWYLFDASDGFARLSDLTEMVFTIYAFWLFWKYRDHEPSRAALLLFVLAYVPVLTYLGWHYTLTGWFIRCAVFWPVVAKLVWIDVCNFFRRNRGDILGPAFAGMTGRSVLVKSLGGSGRGAWERDNSSKWKKVLKWNDTNSMSSFPEGRTQGCRR